MGAILEGKPSTAIQRCSFSQFLGTRLVPPGVKQKGGKYFVDDRGRPWTLIDGRRRLSTIVNDRRRPSTIIDDLR